MRSEGLQKASICSPDFDEGQKDRKEDLYFKTSKKNEEQKQKCQIKSVTKLRQKVLEIDDKFKNLAKYNPRNGIKITKENKIVIKSIRIEEKQKQECLNILQEKRRIISETNKVYLPSSRKGYEKNNPQINKYEDKNQLTPQKSTGENKKVRLAYSEKKTSSQNISVKQRKRHIQKRGRYYLDHIVSKAHKITSDIYMHLQASLNHFMDLKIMSLVEKYTFHENLVYLKQKNIYKNKKTIIFDLDQTLIHSFSNKAKSGKLKCEVRRDGLVNINFNMRPFLRETIKSLSPDFQLMIFTAGEAGYANPIINAIDPQGLIQHRLFRQNCTRSANGMYLKDLRIINRRFEDMVLIDNSAFSFYLHPQNGIPILPFFDDQTDQELKKLQVYLRKLEKVKDVREVNKKYFKLHEYSLYTDTKKLINSLYLKQNNEKS